MSDDHGVQVVAARPAADEMHVWLVVWDTQEEVGDWKVEAVNAAETVTGQVTHREALAVPPDVARELGNAGLIRPPKTVEWLAVQIAGKVSESDPLRLIIRQGSGEPRHVNVFTSDELTTK